MLEVILTPQQVVDALAHMCAEARHTTADLAATGNDEQALVGARCAAALEAALIAYHREHMRLWLEERQVSVFAMEETHRWRIRWVMCSAGHIGRLAYLSCDNPNGWPTADAARAAAAEALGYPGLETVPEEGPAP